MAAASKGDWVKVAPSCGYGDGMFQIVFVDDKEFTLLGPDGRRITVYKKLCRQDIACRAKNDAHREDIAARLGAGRRRR